jgi:hypothetical protein
MADPDESGARRATSRGHGTTCSISARNLSRRVCFFLLAYSTYEKLPCCGIGLSLTIRQPILSHHTAKSALGHLSKSPLIGRKPWIYLQRLRFCQALSLQRLPSSPQPAYVVPTTVWIDLNCDVIINFWNGTIAADKVVANPRRT